MRAYLERAVVAHVFLVVENSVPDWHGSLVLTLLSGHGGGVVLVGVDCSRAEGSSGDGGERVVSSGEES